MKKNATAKAFVMSLLALMMCLSMLVGTTFAWFTDSVTSGVNKIVAGNLDVELYHNATGAATVDAGNKVNTDTELFQIDLWEPGAVVYENFKIVNAGSLALKYDFGFNLAAVVKNYVVEKNGEELTATGRSLADALYIKIVSGTVTAPRPAYTAEDGMKLSDFLNGANPYIDSGTLEAGTDKDVSVVVYWPQSGEDNLFNLKNGWYASAAENSTEKDTANPALYIQLPISLYATQTPHEQDSFGPDYDSNAVNPDARVEELTGQGYVAVSSAEDFASAVAAGKNIVLNGDITLNGTNRLPENAVVDGNGYAITINTISDISGKNITVKNATFKSGNGSAWGIATGCATYENCVFDGVSPYITPNAGLPITVRNCTFNDTMLQICWAEGEHVDPATIKTDIVGNTFNYTATDENYHVIALNADSADFSKVNVSGNTFNNKGVPAFSALYITTASAGEIVDNYKDNTETNAAVGYRGSDGYARFVTAEDAVYLVFDNGGKVLAEVTAETEEYTIAGDVTAIGNFAFSVNPSVKKVIVPASVTDLGRGFDSSSVEEVVLSEGLETISSRAFRKTPNLKTLVIPSTVKTIEENAFQQSGIETIVIPASVGSIGDAGFGYCPNLTTVTIEGNPVIANYAFRACASLTDVYLKGDNVTFADGISMVFTVAEDNNDNSQITIHVANEAVKARVEAVTRGGINIVIDQA